MSLKAFHVIFIGAAVLLAIWLGAWSLGQRQATLLAGQPAGSWLLLACGSFVAAVALVIYEAWFLRKTRGVSPW